MIKEKKATNPTHIKNERGEYLKLLPGQKVILLDGQEATITGVNQNYMRMYEVSTATIGLANYGAWELRPKVS